ncbi:MAG: hypothetical protein E7256_10175 [Lachnospiraceae bacterium]|nr:hypothetical protein [Lachnospiraceae bacterium]
MKTKKLIMLVLTAIIFTISTTNINVFAANNTTKTSAKAASYTNYEVKLLASLVYCEAGYEPYEGKVAVANTVLNRVKSDVYDHVTCVKEAVYDLKRWGRQYSPAYVKKPNGTYTTKGSLLESAMKMYSSSTMNSTQKKAMAQCKKAAIAALEGENNVSTAVAFSSSVTTMKKKLAAQNKYYKIIGNHIFY